MKKIKLEKKKRNMSIKKLQKAGASYRDIAKKFKISAKRSWEIVHDK